MRHPGFLIIASCLFVLGLTARWIDFPIRRDVSAFQWNLLNNLPSGGRYAWASHGILFILLAAVSLTFMGRRPALSRGAAMVLVLVTLTVPFRITFSNPEALLSLVREHGQYANISIFSQTYLPMNRGEEPDYRPVLETETVFDRLKTGLYFLGSGWYFILLGVLILAGLAGTRAAGVPCGRRYWIGLSAFTAALLAVFLFRPVVGDYFIRRAAENKAMGRLEQALTDYQTALRWDAWHRFDPGVAREIGSLYAATGDNRRPEYHLYKGFAYEKKDQTSEAIFEYEKAARSPDFSISARAAIVEVLVKRGLTYYGEGKTVSSIEAWRRALALDDQRLDVLFFLGRAHYDVAEYGTAVEFNKTLLADSASPQVLADLHSNLGDCYTRLEAYAAARNHYNLSRELDDDQNYRALISLVGI